MSTENPNPPKQPGLLRRLYDWVLHWAHTPYGTPALVILSFCESSFFPIPPDPLLMALSLSRVKRALWYATVCSAASVIGGIFGYWIGMELWHLVSNFFFTYIPGFTQEVFDLVRQKYNDHAFLAVFSAGFTPIPYKVFTISAGVFEISFMAFVLGSVTGRSMRFFLVAGLIRLFGEKIKQFIDKYFDLLSIAFVVLLVLGFVVIKLLA